MIENRAIGIKSREVYEAPAAIDADRRAPGARGPRADEGRARREARDRGPRGRRTSTTGSGSAPSARRSTRSSTKTQELVTGEVRVQLRPARRGRQRPALGVRALRRDARVVRDRRDLPARGGRGLHPARLARGRAGRGAGARQVARYDALGRPRRGPARPRGLGVPPGAHDAELFPYDCGATRLHARRLAAARDPRPTSELAEVEARLSDARRATHDRTRTDEDVHSAIERAARAGRAGRSTPAARATTRSQRRSASTSRTPAPRRSTAIEALAGGRARPSPRRRPTRSCPATRTSSARSRSRSASTSSPGSRCSTATATGSRSRRRRPSPRRSARARSPGRRCRSRGRPARCGTRSTRSPTATSRSTTSTPRAVLFVHLSRIGEELVLWASAEFGFARLPEDGGDRLVDDAAEAEPRRRRARPRQGRHGDRAAHRPARDGEGPAARLQPRPPGGQAAGRSTPAATCAQALARARACWSRGLEFDHERLAAAAADPLLLATDAAEALVAEGMPFRDAHEQVAAAVREGTFDPDSTAAESVRGSRLGDVALRRSPRLAPAFRRSRRGPRRG